MVGTPNVGKPTMALPTKSPGMHTNYFGIKCKNVFSFWVFSTSKFGKMGKTGPERVSITNRLPTKPSPSRSCGDQFDKTFLYSVLRKISEVEGVNSVVNSSWSKRKLMALAVMLGLCSTHKFSIAGETTEQGDGQSTTMSDSSKPSVTRKSIFGGLLNIKSWYKFRGDGFTLRVPPDFDDIMEPEDYSAGLSLYGERAKPKTFAARFASPDRSEALSVVIRPANELKLTLLEAQDISDLGSLREAASLFVPGGSTLYTARMIKFKESEVPRTYYFYEFSAQDRHVALEAAVSKGRVFVVGATAPRTKWEDDGKKLRSATISFSLV